MIERQISRNTHQITILKYVFINIYRSRSISEKLLSNWKSFIKIKNYKKCKFKGIFGFLLQQSKPELNSFFTN